MPNALRKPMPNALFAQFPLNCIELYTFGISRRFVFLLL